MATITLGADAGGTAVKFVLMDGAGRTVAEGEVATDRDNVDTTLARLVAAVAEHPEGARIDAVGLACAGIVDPESGRLGRSPNLPGWEQGDLGAALARVLPGVPAVLVNDVNAALYGEYRAGAGRGCRDLVMLALGTGVGGGLLIEGTLRIGGNFGAGELGHMVLDPQGPRCACGNRGCLEAWAGSRAILRAAREAAAGDAELAALVADRGENLTTRELAELAAAGVVSARGIFAAAGERLGQAIGNLINILDPERVIVGGGVARAGELILAPCRREAPRYVLAAGARSTPIVTAELGTGAAAVGAAWLAFEAGAGTE